MKIPKKDRKAIRIRIEKGIPTAIVLKNQIEAIKSWIHRANEDLHLMHLKIRLPSLVITIVGIRNLILKKPVPIGRMKILKMLTRSRIVKT